MEIWVSQLASSVVIVFAHGGSDTLEYVYLSEQLE